MKLYTEEQVKEMLSMTDMIMYGNLIPNNDILASMTPIELPTRTEHCKHESFVMDKQIRTIECTRCGMRSWLEKDRVDLFASDLTAPKNTNQ